MFIRGNKTREEKGGREERKEEKGEGRGRREAGTLAYLGLPRASSVRVGGVDQPRSNLFSFYMITYISHSFLLLLLYHFVVCFFCFLCFYFCFVIFVFICYIINVPRMVPAGLKRCIEPSPMTKL